MKTNIVTIKIIKTNKELQIIKLSENLFMDMESVSIFVTESGTTLTGKDNFVIEGPMYVPKYYKIVTTTDGNITVNFQNNNNTYHYKIHPH